MGTHRRERLDAIWPKRLVAPQEVASQECFCKNLQLFCVADGRCLRPCRCHKEECPYVCIFFSANPQICIFWSPLLSGFHAPVSAPNLSLLDCLAHSRYLFLLLCFSSFSFSLLSAHSPPPPLLLAVSLFPSLILLSRCLCNVTLPCILENMSIILRS